MALFRRRERSPGEKRALPRLQIPGTMSFSTSPAPAQALSIADAFACVRAISDAAASIPLVPYRERAQGRERLRGGQLAGLLRRPATGSPQSALIWPVLAHLNLYGNAYIGKWRDQDGRITALAPIHPDEVVPELVNGEPVYNYAPRVGGRRQQLKVSDLVHVRGLTVDGLDGLSPVRQARTALMLSAQLSEHAEAFFGNDARPSGILRLARFGDVAAQVEDLREQFEAQHQGEPHRIAVVAGDIDFTQLSMPLDDAQFLEQRKLSAVEVCRIFRVPPWMIGADAGGSMTYSNVESQSLAFVTYCLRPWLVAIEQAISADDDLCPGPLYVEFSLDALLRADSRTRSEVYARALDPTTGWMTRAEVRALENLEPEPAGPVAPAPAVVVTNGAGS